MAYVNRISRRQRGPMMIAVIALQIGVVFALINGLSVIIPPPVKDQPLVATQIDLPKVDETKQTEQVKEKPVPQPEQSQSTRNLVPPRADPITKVDLGTFPSEIDIGPVGPINLVPLPPPLPPVGPKFTPRAATPRGSPGLWVTSTDYPAGELRMRHEGQTRFRLSIGADGSIADCTIVASSGHDGLDRATCANLTRRGKFKAATDGEGKAVAGSYSGAVRWKLPPNY